MKTRLLPWKIQEEPYYCSLKKLCWSILVCFFIVGLVFSSMDGLLAGVMQVVAVAIYASTKLAGFFQAVGHSTRVGCPDFCWDLSEHGVQVAF